MLRGTDWSPATPILATRANGPAPHYETQHTQVSAFFLWRVEAYISYILRQPYHGVLGAALVQVFAGCLLLLGAGAYHADLVCAYMKGIKIERPS